MVAWRYVLAVCVGLSGTPFAAAAPIATTNAATSVTQTSATLNGTVNTNSGFDSTVTFQYGLTAAYGATVSATPSTVGAFDNNKAVSAAITGLACATTYHFRVSATSNTGTTNGADMSFTTGTCPTNGACGGAGGSSFFDAPTIALCTAGNASAVSTGNSAFTWTCSGLNGGSDTSCSATRQYQVTTSVGAGVGSVGASGATTYNAVFPVSLTPGVRYRVGSVGGTCGGSINGNVFNTSPIVAACTVAANFVPDTVRNALFVNASTSVNKTSIVYVVNPSTQTGAVTATAYAESGAQLGTASAPLGTIGAGQTLTFTSAQLEAGIGFTPAAPTSKYRVSFDTGVAGAELVNIVRDIASGELTLAQAQIDNRVFSSALVATRNALFISAASSPNKTTVLRIINTGDSSGSLVATAYNEAGAAVGNPSVLLGNIGPRQMLTFTSSDLEALFHYTPPDPTSKYRIVISSTVAVEIINFVRDNATLKLTLGQSQIDSTPQQLATAFTVRNALVVEASSNSSATTVVRVVNLSDSGAALTGTAYDESGATVGTSDAQLGFLGPQQMLTFTSAQLEAAIGYAVAATTKARVAFKSSIGSYQVINYRRDNSTLNLNLAQPQVDNRASTGTSTSTSRTIYALLPSSTIGRSSEVRVVNTSSSGGSFTVTAFDESGTRIGNANAVLATLNANQSMSFTALQLEAAVGIATPPPTARYRYVLAANLSTFEAIYTIFDTTSRAVTLGQEQID